MAIRPDKLIEQAEGLAGIGAGAGRPREADLRRAISSAYYALYHELILLAVAQAMPAASASDRAKAARWFSHGDVKAVCEWVIECATKPTPKKNLLESGVWSLFSREAAVGRVSAVPLDLMLAADAFVTLIDARHEADYDHEARVSRAAAQVHVLWSKDAVLALRRSRTDAYVQKFLVLLLARASRLR